VGEGGVEAAFDIVLDGVCICTTRMLHNKYCFNAGAPFFYQKLMLPGAYGGLGGGGDQGEVEGWEVELEVTGLGRGVQQRVRDSDLSSWAARKTRIATLLLARNADVNATSTRDSKTAVMFAADWLPHSHGVPPA